LESTSPKAAYIGASNDDDPVFYTLFEGAMDLLGIKQRRHIKAAYNDDDKEWVEESDLILLAGGDVAKGWDVLDGTDMKQDLIQRYYGGAILVGISAGAIQLGLGGWGNEEPGDSDLLETFKLIPFYLDAHDEDNKWGRLKAVANAAESHAKCIGIPKGGGMIYHPDHTLEPVRQPLV
jgi:cyanophycinase-like exopeptidase